mgnify:CR=1 FL=1
MIKIVFIGLILHATISWSQTSVLTAGGDSSNSLGSISYSIGLVDYANVEDQDGSINLGTQVPYEIVTLSGNNDNLFDIGIKVYPNPSSAYIYIKSLNQNHGKLRYQFYNLLGQILDQGPIHFPETRIDIYDYSVATYFLSIQSGNGEVKRIKIIKNN